MDAGRNLLSLLIKQTDAEATTVLGVEGKVDKFPAVMDGGDECVSALGYGVPLRWHASLASPAFGQLA
jgi:hypothetical protein